MVAEIADLVDLSGLMFRLIMKFAFVSLLLCFSIAGFSQRQYFVLLESENRQPIYVRIGETIYNSSSIGHVIIPALSDSVYVLEIGLASDQSSSNQFTIRINKKDHGYQLKKLSDKGWVLFNFQTTELVYPAKKDGLAQSGYSLVKRDDGFAKLLSQVVNDTAVLYSIVYQKPVEPVVKIETKSATVDSHKEETAITKKEDPPLAKKEESIKEPAEQLKQVAKVPVVAVAKVQEVESDSGKHIVYLDDKDSVRIFIGADLPVVKNSEEGSKESKKSQTPDTNINTVNKSGTVLVGVASTDSGKISETTKLPDAAQVVPQAEQKKEVRDTVSQQKKLVLLNSDCKALAWDNDVDKIRLKMLNEKDVDSKIGIARKVFKTKCFTAAQIKGLTELFVTDQDKYKFLDAAYPFVFDTENFKQLSYLLSDDYYVKRFRTMVRLD